MDGWMDGWVIPLKLLRLLEHLAVLKSIFITVPIIPNIGAAEVIVVVVVVAMVVVVVVAVVVVVVVVVVAVVVVVVAVVVVVVVVVVGKLPNTSTSPRLR